LGAGVATFLATPSSANLAAAVTDETGTGALVFANSPTLVTPALGTPASGVVTNLTGTASININGTVGATTASTGAFTTLTTSSTVTLSGGTANGVAYLNGSKVLTTGSALTFDGTNLLQVNAAAGKLRLGVNTSDQFLDIYRDSGSGASVYNAAQGSGFGFHVWQVTAAEQMRLTSTGLGIGTSSPGFKLDVGGQDGTNIALRSTGTASAVFRAYVNSAEAGTIGFLNGGGTYFEVAGSEQMRLTSTGLGIGTSSPGYKLDVLSTGVPAQFSSSNASNTLIQHTNTNAAKDLIYRFRQNAGAGNFYDLTMEGATNAFTIDYNDTTRLTLDSSGNLGLGVTPSAWGARALQLPNGVFLSANSGSSTPLMNLGANNYFDVTASNWLYSGNFEATRYAQISGQHIWYTAPSGTAGDAISFTQAMTLDADGDLLVGGTTGTAGGRLTVTTANAGYVAVEPTSSVTSQIATGLRLHGNINETDRYVGIFCFNGAANNVNSMTFWTTNSGVSGERMRLDNSGALGIGTTNPAYKLTVSAPDNNGVLISSGNDSHTGFLYFGDTASNTVGALSYDHSSNAMRFQTAGSERARITSGGDFGIGTSSPSSKLDLRGTSDTAGATIQVVGNTVSSLLLGQNADGGVIRGQGGTDVLSFWTGGSGDTGAGQSGSEKARITGSGDLLVGTTTSGARLTVSATNNACSFFNTTSASATVYTWNQGTTGDNIFQEFATEGSYTVRGSIAYNRTAGLVAYNVTSDYRAKDIIGPVVDSGALIDSTPVYMGKMKGATQERPMFIAHEVPAYAHTGVKDAVDADGKPVYQQMDASALIPVMWAEIQSLRARLAAANI
jgi:hypothetical protein